MIYCRIQIGPEPFYTSSWSHWQSISARTQGGWMNSKIFLNWFTHHYLVHSQLSRPILLLDDHSTYYNPSFVRRAAKEMVIVFCLPPNMTTWLDPWQMHICSFKDMYWNLECQSFMSKNSGRYMTEYDFLPLFSKAWYRSMTIPNIVSALRTTGIYPFDCNAINVIDSTLHINNPISLTERTGLAFIPLYSPACNSSAPSCKTITKPTVTFTSKEIAHFIRRYEEGYDITTDERWILMYRY